MHSVQDVYHLILSIMAKQDYSAPSPQTLIVHARRRRLSIEHLLEIEGIEHPDDLAVWCVEKNVLMPDAVDTLFKKKPEPKQEEKPEAKVDVERPRKKQALTLIEEGPHLLPRIELGAPQDKKKKEEDPA